MFALLISIVFRSAATAALVALGLWLFLTILWPLFSQPLFELIMRIPTWVLTVGASSHMGTTDRADDTIAPFSSRGPSAIDQSVKPDLVAPGVGLESLSDPDSAFYTSKASGTGIGSLKKTMMPSPEK